MLAKHLKICYKFSVRVRYAPSPTGPMHLGAVRTALFNYMFAKHNNGKFIVRIEDTDLERNVQGSAQEILDTLDWLGIRADQSMRAGGIFQPYVQSQRLDIYKGIQNELMRKGLAYPCFCETTSGKKPKAKGQQQHSEGYDGKCRKLSGQQISSRIKNGQKYAIRIKSNIREHIPHTFKDELHGTVTAVPFDDYILVKKNGYPTYHFANVIDDWRMKITHVIRGMEWLQNTPKHIYLYNLLGVRPPVFVHLPLIFTTDGRKLSKRDPTAPIVNLKAKGYLPQAIINYTGLMGYNPKPVPPEPKQPQPQSQSPPKQKTQPPTQFYSLSQLCQQFSLQKVKPSPVKSDQKKLNYFNRYYMRKKWKQQDKQFVNQVLAYLRGAHGLKEGMREYGDEFLKEVVECIMERVNYLEEFRDYGYFFTHPDLRSEHSMKDIKKIFGNDVVFSQVQGKTKLINISPQTHTKTLKILHNLRLIFTHILTPTSYTDTKIAQQISQFLFDHKDLQNEDVYHLLRLAVTGHKSGVNIVRTCWVVGRERVTGDLERLSGYIQ